jgi:C-terminal processing protease CtpA/Prc
MSDYTLAQRPYYFALNWAAPAPFADWKDERVEAAAPQDRYTDKPVVLLTGTGCFSACDTFTSALKTNRLATVVGEPTGGGSGQPLVFKLPDSGMSFRYGVVRGITADGKPIEGVGTAPDQLIERTQQERIDNRDQQLLSALVVLQKQIGDRTTPLGAPAPGLAQTEAAVTAALRGVGPIWDQDTDLSPSRALDRELRRLSAVDELQ